MTEKIKAGVIVTAEESGISFDELVKLGNMVVGSLPAVWNRPTLATNLKEKSVQVIYL